LPTFCKSDFSQVDELDSLQVTIKMGKSTYTCFLSRLLWFAHICKVIKLKKVDEIENTQWDCRWWIVTRYHAIIWPNLFPSYDQLTKPLRYLSNHLFIRDFWIPWLNLKLMKLTNTQWDCQWWIVTSYHAIIWPNLFPSYDQLAKPR
jgi:hypothetical protein